MASLTSNRHGGLLRDRDWVRKSFMLSTVNMNDAAFRLQTLATQKFTDTRLGGNFTINNVPQYTRTADIRVSGLNSLNQILPGSSKGQQGQHVGMGRFYSEQIDDNSQQIFLQFGLPQFNGMASFFTGFYDNEAGRLANEGISTIAYYAGYALGLVIGVAAFPLLLVGSVASFFLSRPANKYYYMKETMGLYWNRVNMISNTIGVNLGLVPRINPQTDTTKISPEFAGDTPGGAEDWRAYAHAMEPDIFSEKGGVNVYAIANRAQRLDDQRYKLELEAFGGDNFTPLSAFEKFKAFITGEGVANIAVSQPPKVAREGVEGSDNSLYDFLAQYHKLAIGNLSSQRKDAIIDRASEGVETLQAQAEQPAGSDAKTTFPTKVIRNTYIPDANGNASLQTLQPGYGNEAGFADYWKANQREGGTYVGFRIDATGSVSESFTNSTKESDISGKINGVSSSSRSARFSFSDGNTGFDVIDGAISAAKAAASGFLDSVHMSGLLSLAGSAYVDIPEQWQDSTASFPTSSFTIELRAPYGHVLSRYMNLHLPLACLLAGALPLSTGKQSYTSPFLCSLYHKGKNQIRLGMIDSLSITRCTGNMGITNNGECLGIDVTVSIKDLSKVLHAPIENGFSPLAPWKDGLISDDSAFKDYMAVLSNLSLADQTYAFRKMFLNLTRKSQNIDTYFSRAHFAQATSSNFLTRWPGTMYGIFTRGGTPVQL